MCAENGFCFLSIFPEEHVLGCILAKHRRYFPRIKFKKLWIYDNNNDKYDPTAIEIAKKGRYFFFGVGDYSQNHLSELPL